MTDDLAIKASSPVRLVLVASDGKPASLSALRAAQAVARMHGATVKVISVFTPRIPYPATEGERSVAPSDRDDHGDQEVAVRRQLEQAGADWTLLHEVGYVGPCVAVVARRERADLIIVGIGRPSPAHRFEGERNAVAIALCADLPILAAAGSFGELPRRILVAVGLDDRCVAAAALSRQLLPMPASVSLVHVAPPVAGTFERSPSVERQFTVVRDAMALDASVPVVTETRLGVPVQELAEHARANEVDLIVAGVNGRDYDERSVMRNVGLGLLLTAECSVMLMPERRDMTCAE